MGYTSHLINLALKTALLFTICLVLVGYLGVWYTASLWPDTIASRTLVITFAPTVSAADASIFLNRNGLVGDMDSALEVDFSRPEFTIVANVPPHSLRNYESWINQIDGQNEVSKVSFKPLH